MPTWPDDAISPRSSPGWAFCAGSRVTRSEATATGPDLARRPARSSRVLAQQGQDALVLLSLDDGSYFSLNEVGAVVWDLCDGARTLADVIAGVCAEFDATPEEVTPDVVSLVDDLASEKLLVEG